MDVQQLLDAAKQAQNITTDSALAKALGVTKQAVSNWRHGAKLPDPVACATIAGLAGIPLAKVLGIVGEARAISREEKAVWRKLAATATVLLLAVAPYFNTAAAYAPEATSQAQDAATNRHYAKWWHGLLAFIRRLVRWGDEHETALLA